jgi:hypothetical protein
MEGFYPSRERTAADGFTPMGALLKAICINSAKPLTGDYRRSGLGSALRDNAPPNFEAGFGLLALDRTLLLKGHSNSARSLFLDGDFDAMSSVGNRQYKDYVFAVPSDEAASVKVTMVYQDAPALSMSRVALVNDLDVQLTDGSRLGNQQRFYPNNRNRKDAVNNVEHISVVGLAETFTIRVSGYAVPVGPQPYALVVSGSSFSLKETVQGTLEPLSTASISTEEPVDGDDDDVANDAVAQSGDSSPDGLVYFFGGLGVAFFGFVVFHVVTARRRVAASLGGGRGLTK